MTSRRQGNTAAIATAAVAGLAALAGCEPRTRRTPDDTLVVLVETAPRTSDPRKTINSFDQKLSRLVCPGLTVLDTPDMAPAPGLATTIERIDDLTWDVAIRPDVRFSDGTPLTTDDVAWTYTSAMADSKTWSERFTTIERVDERRVRFHLKKPLATMMTDLDMGIAARHGVDGKGNFPGGRALCAGPYQVDSLSADRVRLSANPYYFGPAPRTPRVDIKVVRDAAARIVMLAGGSADLVQNSIRPDLVDDVLARPRLREQRGPSNVLSYMMFNLNDPVVKDPRVRHAIELAIDRRSIVARKFAGRAVLATSLLPPGHWAYRPQALVERDLAAAGRLLDEAGYRDPDGPGGRPRLSLVYKTSSDQFRLAIARVIAAQLAQLDVAVEVRAFEFGTFFADIKKGAYQIASMQTAEIIEPDMFFPYFHSSRIPDVGHPDDTNRWRYVNHDLDALLEAGRAESDRGKRIAIYTEAQAILARDLPIIPLWHEDNVAVVNVDVDGFEVLPSARWSAFARAGKR